MYVHTYVFVEFHVRQNVEIQIVYLNVYITYYPKPTLS
jgi:hypothetical protein